MAGEKCRRERHFSQTVKPAQTEDSRRYAGMTSFFSFTFGR